MKMKALVLAVLVVGVFLVGCEKQVTYDAYSQQPQGQGAVVGGGCGVAPNGDYEDTPLAKIFNEVENF